jgi:hypothetical protein
MKKKAVVLMASVFLFGAGWIATGLFRPKIKQPRSSTAGTHFHQPEPVGWVFGRLLNMQPSAYSPSGMGAMPPPKKTPGQP